MASARWNLSGIAGWLTLTAAVEAVAFVMLLTSGALLPAALVLVIALITSAAAYIGFRQKRG